MTLADLGAEVIKVEPPNGDDTRHWGPPFVAGESTYYLSANRGKQSIVLDLKSAEGKQALWDLIASANVVVENFRPGTLERLGFGWEALHGRHPAVILVSISGYGQTGPQAQRPGYDLIAQGEGGLMGVTGEPGRLPVKVGFSVADLGAGMWAIIGTLAALRARDATGQGDHVDVSLLETVVSWQTYLAEAFLLAGDVAQPLGSAHPSIAPYQTFNARDGHFTLAVGNDSLWTRFCDMLDAADADSPPDSPERPEPWYRAPRYARNADRVRLRAELIPPLNAIFSARPRAEWLARLREAGIPAGSVNSIEEVFEHPQVRARGLVQEVDHPAVGRMAMVRTPITFTQAELAAPTAPPQLGADTVAVLRAIGYSEEQIAVIAEHLSPARQSAAD